MAVLDGGLLFAPALSEGALLVPLDPSVLALGAVAVPGLGEIGAVAEEDGGELFPLELPLLLEPELSQAASARTVTKAPVISHRLSINSSLRCLA